MATLPSIVCKFIGHRRSARQVYLNTSDHRWHSRCRHCGTPMRKEWPKGWQAKKAA